jgi:hypothetical protein
MRLYRYRCALVPALLCAGVLLTPQCASAQGMFNSSLQSTIHEMIDLIGKAVARDMPRGKVNLLDNALMDLVRVLEDRGPAHHHHGHFAQGMHRASNNNIAPMQREQNHGNPTAMSTSGNQNHERGGFASGLRTAAHDVADLLGTAVAQNRSPADVRRLDEAFHDLMRVLEDRPSSHGRFAAGANGLCKCAGQHDGETKKGTKNAANSKAIGNLTGKKDHTSKQLTKNTIPPPTNTAHAKNNPGNLVGVRTVNKTAPTNPATAAVAKNAPHHPLRQTVASVKTGTNNTAKLTGPKTGTANSGLSSIAKAGPVTHSIRMAANNPANLAHARYGPAAFKGNPMHNFVPAFAKAAPVNFSAGRSK